MYTLLRTFVLTKIPFFFRLQKWQIAVARCKMVKNLVSYARAAFLLISAICIMLQKQRKTFYLIKSSFINFLLTMSWKENGRNTHIHYIIHHQIIKIRSKTCCSLLMSEQHDTCRLTFTLSMSNLPTVHNIFINGVAFLVFHAISSLILTCKIQNLVL